MPKNVLGIDFGASSGRAILGSYKNNRLELTEIYRFENNPITENGMLYWDIETLFNEIKKSLQLASSQYAIDSIGIDTWGVDFGLIDHEGKLIDKPVHYRDNRTDGMIEEARKSIDLTELYKLTGIQIMNINTVFQLLTLLKKNESALKKADKFLLMPDLFNYLLTGKMKAEATIASTSQLFDPYKKVWSEEIIQRLNLPQNIFPEIITPGTVIGKIKESLANEWDIPEIPIIAIASHDTASAVASVPVPDDEFLFVSCGTWSLVGTELDKPIISEKSLSYNITNEEGVDGTTRFLKNNTGLWIIQETKRQFEREGKHYSYNEISKLAEGAVPFKCFIDTEYETFQSPGSMPEKIKNYARETNQPVPETDGEIFRCIYESLAMKYQDVFKEIMESAGKKYKKVNIVGGGSQAEILCKMVANASNLEVIAGPVEATVIGNCIVQLISQNEISNLKEGRRIVSQSFDVKSYHPEDYDTWKNQFKRYKQLIQLEATPVHR